jgi:hypothetical protein
MAPVNIASSISVPAPTRSFTLTGFSPVKREGFVLAADFVATANGELKVGGIEETVTVSGESPIVDVQTTKKQQMLDLDLVQSIPTARGYAAVMLLIPSMTVSGGGNANVQLSPGMIVFGGRGGRGNEGQSQIDGLGTGAAINGGGVSGYGQLETAQEVVMTTAGGLGESEQGGPIVNFIPKTGGNSFQHHFYGSGMSNWMQSSNYTSALQAAGMTTPQETLYLAEASLSDGGPIKKDRIWFFYNTRYSAAGNTLPGIYYNLNAGDPTKWLYAPDLTRSVANKQTGSINPTLRLTAQVTPRNSLKLYWDPSSYRLSDNPAIGGILSDSGRTGNGDCVRRHRLQGRLLAHGDGPVDVADDGPAAAQPACPRISRTGTAAAAGSDRSLIPVTEQCTAGCRDGNIQGLVYRAELELRFHGADPVERRRRK